MCDDEFKKLKYYYNLTLHIQEDDYEYGFYVYCRTGSIELNYYSSETDLRLIIEELIEKIDFIKKGNKNENKK